MTGPVASWLHADGTLVQRQPRSRMRGACSALRYTCTMRLRSALVLLPANLGEGIRRVWYRQVQWARLCTEPGSPSPPVRKLLVARTQCKLQHIGIKATVGSTNEKSPPNAPAHADRAHPHRVPPPKLTSSPTHQPPHIPTASIPAVSDPENNKHVPPNSFCTRQSRPCSISLSKLTSTSHPTAAARVLHARATSQPPN